MRSLALVVAFGVLLAFVACAEEATPPATSATDAGTQASDGAVSGGADGGTDSAVDVSTPTNETSASVTIGGVGRELDRAQFGVTSKDGTFYIEAHEGGVAECPEKETPKRTLIISGVPKGSPGAKFTHDDGVTVSFLDFAGDQIKDGQPLRKATAVSVALVAAKDTTSVELEVDATFSDGSAKGRVYATYCAAMNE